MPNAEWTAWLARPIAERQAIQNKVLAALLVLALAGCARTLDPAPAAAKLSYTGPQADASSSPTGFMQISPATSAAINDRIRECWVGEVPSSGSEKQSVRLQITTDEAGTVRDVKALQVPPGEAGRAFATRALRSALHHLCAILPLPHNMMGAVHTFEIAFRP